MKQINVLQECARSEAQFLVPDWGMKRAIASGCRTGRYATQTGGPVSQPDAIAGFILQSGTKKTATAPEKICIKGIIKRPYIILNTIVSLIL